MSESAIDYSHALVTCQTIYFEMFLCFIFSVEHQYDVDGLHVYCLGYALSKDQL